MMPPRNWPVSRQRLLALSMSGLATLFLVVTVAGPAIHKHRQYDAAIDQLVFQIERLEHSISRRDAIEQEKRRLREALVESDTTFPAVGTSVAGSRLQSRLQERATETAEFDLQSIQILEPVAAEPFTEISVRIQARSGIEGLRDYLYRIETERPLTWVDSLQIQPDRRRTTTGGAVLEISMNVSTLMDTGGIKPDPR